MRISDIEQNTPEWIEERRGKVLGSIAQDVIPKPPLKADVEKALRDDGMEFIQDAGGVPPTSELLRRLLPIEALVELGRREDRKVGFYQLIADILGIPPDDENRMDRGHRLEDEACDMLTDQTGKKIHKVGICMRDEEPRIANSPDGLIKNRGKWSEAVEVKCLKSALHLQALIENKIPAEYWSQAMQYFVVNDDLKTLYFVFYDPRVTAQPFHVIQVHREDVTDTVAKLLAYQRDTLVQVDAIVAELAF